MPQRCLLILFSLAFGLASAQITNVRKWRKSEVDSLDHALFLYDEHMYEQACPLFEGIHRNHPKEEFVKYSFAKTALFRSDKHEEAYLLLTELYPKYNDIPDMKYDIALASLYNLHFDEAEEYLDKFMASKRLSLQDKRKADALRKNILYARYYSSHPTQALVSNLGENINGPGDEYVPAITADDSMMIYTYTGENSIGGRQNEYMQPDPKGFYNEDIYQSFKSNGIYGKFKPLDSLNSNLPEAAISISMDGRVLFLYQNLDDGHGDIYTSVWNGTYYTKPKKAPGLNSYSWDGHCCLAPDGRTLYFSSERVGGYGGRDLYKAELLADSSWGNISNLGDTINTRFDEDAPFMFADGRTFFFSSKGHTSTGGFDIFRTMLNQTDSTFTLPVENLGWPINSTDDDIYFVLAADGKTGYYSSGRKGGFGLKDIYMVKPEFGTPLTPVLLVKGTVKAKEEAVEAYIQLIDLNTNKAVSAAHSNKGTGSYLLSMPQGSRYRVQFRYKDLKTRTMDLDAANTEAYRQIVMNVDLETGQDSLLASPLAVNNNTATSNTPTSSPVSESSTLSPVTSMLSSSVTTEPVKSPTLAAVVTASAVVAKSKDGFVPRTKYQEKTMRYVEKYGDISVEGLVFKVQFAAFKSGKNFSYPELTKLGKIERMMLGDSYTRLTIGGNFKTLKAAFNMNKKVVNAGQTEAFIVTFYKGQRSTFEELEKKNIFK
ncbi:MAG TPA: hypothetical protein PLQ93_03625 [Bacteroidia bacterium]|nr:hypothetical protein [Bacteroidia bacterium]